MIDEIRDENMLMLEHIADAIAESAPVKDIYLFGSYAYGTPTENSDVDLYVVLDDSYEGRLLDVMALIRRSIRAKGYAKIPMDIIARKHAEYEYMKTRFVLESEVAKKGKRIYHVA